MTKASSWWRGGDSSRSKTKLFLQPLSSWRTLNLTLRLGWKKKKEKVGVEVMRRGTGLNQAPNTSGRIANARASER